MSTRAQIIVKDRYSEVWFYRHSDGYREGVKPTLDKFCEWLREGKIRRHPMQSAGWLVMLGAEEYRNIHGGPDKTDAELLAPCVRSPYGTWKVGAYEPCAPRVHGDVEHLWVVDVEKAEWYEDARTRPKITLANGQIV